MSNQLEKIGILNCFEIYFTVTDRDNYTTVKRILTSSATSAELFCKLHYKLKDVVSIEQLKPMKQYCDCCGQYKGTVHFSKQEIENGTWERSLGKYNC